MDIARVTLGCLLLAAPSSAQVLRADGATTAPGGAAVVPIVFEAAEGQPVAALQWELAVPGGKGIEPRRPSASAAAAEAGKTISCTGTWKKGGGTYLWTCILAGGASPIPSGLVASAPLATTRSARPGTHGVTLDRVKGAGPDSKAVAVKARPGRLVIE